MQIITRELHFAAFLKANGAKLIKVESKAFVFESQQSEQEWRVAHSNSCCRKVDLELLDLRRLQRNEQRQTIV
jgi:hypothetical protein